MNRRKIFYFSSSVILIIALFFGVSFYLKKNPSKADYAWPQTQHFPSAKVGYFSLNETWPPEGKNSYAQWIADHIDLISSISSIDLVKQYNPNIITTFYEWYFSYPEGFNVGSYADPTKYTKIYQYVYSNNIDPEDFFFHFITNAQTNISTGNPMLEDKFKYVYIDTTDRRHDAYGNANAFSFGQTVNSYLYVGHSFKFKEINFAFNSPGINWNGSWEYWNGSVWNPLSVTSDTTKVSYYPMSQNGKVEFWQPPSDWKMGVVNNLTPSYWVRLKTTSLGNRYPTVETIKNQKFYHIDANSGKYYFPGWDPSQDTNNDGVRDTAPGTLTDTNSSSALFEAWARPVTEFAAPDPSSGFGGWISYTTNIANPTVQNWIVNDDIATLSAPPSGNIKMWDGFYYDGIDARDPSFLWDGSSSGIVELPTATRDNLARQAVASTNSLAKQKANAMNKIVGGNATHHAANLDIERAENFALREFFYNLWGTHRYSDDLENSGAWKIFAQNSNFRVMGKEGIKNLLSFHYGFFQTEDSNLSTILTAGMTKTSTIANVESTSIFPSSGSLWIGTEKINYSGKTATSFTGLARGVDGTVAQDYTESGKWPWQRVIPSSNMDREKIYMLALFYLVQNPSTDYFVTWNAVSYYTNFTAEGRAYFVNAVQHDIGQPTGNIPSGVPSLASVNPLTNNDWGVFVLASGSDFHVYGRDYSKAIVIAKPKTSAGFGDVSKTTVNLPVTTDNPSGRYYLLNENNTISPTAINSIDLRSVEGAILMKESSMTGIDLNKSEDKTLVMSGDVITYTINYQNLSLSETYPNVKIEDNIPNGTTYVCGSADSSGGIPDIVCPNTTKIIWNLGNKSPGATGTVSFQVRIQ